MKGMKGKKRKWMPLLSLLLCVLLAVPSSSAAAEEALGSGEGGTWKVDASSWTKAAWKVDTECKGNGGGHDFYSDDAGSDKIIEGPFGLLLRANTVLKLDLEATCDYGPGKVTFRYCKACKTWVIVGTTVKEKCEDNRHQWLETQITKNATCTKEGGVYQSCEICGILKQLSSIPKEDHDFQWVTVKEASCSGVVGERQLKCTKCGVRDENQSSEEIQPPAHEFDEGKVIKEPQSDVEGLKEFACKKCGFKKTESIPALPHQHKFVTNPRNCEEEQCYLCGEKQPSNKKHTVTEWSDAGSAEHRGKCEVCGRYVTEEHQYEDDNDCTTDVNCTVCGKQIQKGYSEHNKYPQISGGSATWIYMDLGNGMHARKCTNDGCEQTTGVDRHKAGDRKGSCNLCGAASEPDDTTEGTTPGDTTPKDDPEEDRKEETPSVTPPGDTTPKDDPEEDRKEETPSVTPPGDTTPKDDPEEDRKEEPPSVTPPGDTTPKEDPEEDRKEETPSVTPPGDTTPKDDPEEDRKEESPSVTPPGDTTPKDDPEEDRKEEPPSVTTPGDTTPKDDTKDGKGTEKGSATGTGTQEENTSKKEPGTSGGETGSTSDTPANPGTTTDPQAPATEIVVELPEGTDGTLKIENVTKTDEAVKNAVTAKYTEYVAYDITLTRDDEVVQPDGTVKISIELPAGWEDVKVYHMGDTMEEMETTVTDGYAVFTTTHFSVYVVVKTASEVMSPEMSQTSGMPQTTTETVKTVEPLAGQGAILAASSPKTGKSAIGMMAVCIAIFAISALGICVFYGRKKRAER